MKYQILALALLALTASATHATESKNKRGGTTESEPVKCYKIVWGSKDNPGLGLTAGLAIDLCTGSENGLKTANCFAQAWAHPDDGGLGLTAGQSVSLCKPKS